MNRKDGFPAAGRVDAMRDRSSMWSPMVFGWGARPSRLRRSASRRSEQLGAPPRVFGGTPVLPLFFRFMASLDFILTRIGPMNLVAAEVRRRIFSVRDSIRLVTSAATNRRFMGRGFPLSSCGLPRRPSFGSSTRAAASAARNLRSSPPLLRAAIDRCPSRQSRTFAFALPQSPRRCVA